VAVIQSEVFKPTGKSLLSFCRIIIIGFCIFSFDNSFGFQDTQETGQSVTGQVAVPNEPVAGQTPDAGTEADPGMDPGPAAREISGRDIQIGQRLFHGLIPAGPDVPSCASCHNTFPADTFNWNPSAIEIAVLYKERQADDLANAVMNPTSPKMIEVHDGYQLSAEQFIVIKAYMDLLAEEGIHERPQITSLLLFLLVLIIFIAALADLTVTKKIPYKLVHLAVILVAGFIILTTIVNEAISIGRSQYYEPDQPIKFSHQVHALENQTDCLYCHSIAEYSHPAGIPSVSQCMNCHIIVRDGSNSGRFEINKLVRAWEEQTPVRWIRVHNLPDHVFFSHSQHIGIAGLDCNECHGEVEQMHRIMQVKDLSMGWCLDCHRSEEVNILDNEFYSVYIHLQEDVRQGKIDIVTAAATGGTNCMKCHY
jgi:hypothetical protein